MIRNGIFVCFGILLCSVSASRLDASSHSLPSGVGAPTQTAAKAPQPTATPTCYVPYWSIAETFDKAFTGCVRIAYYGTGPECVAPALPPAGVVGANGENIRYGSLDGEALCCLERGVDGTPPRDFLGAVQFYVVRVETPVPGGCSDGCFPFGSEPGPSRVTCTATPTATATSTPTSTGTATPTATRTPDSDLRNICIYVGNRESEEIAVINDRGDTRISIADCPGASCEPWWIALSDDGRRLYAATVSSENGRDNSLAVIDAPDNRVLGYVEIDGSPNGVAISPNGERVYVTDEVNDELIVIDPSDRIVLETIRVGDNPSGVAISRNGQIAFVASANGDSLGIVDLENSRQIDAIPVGEDPRDVTLTPDGSEVFVADRYEPSVTAIYTATLTVRGTVAFAGSEAPSRIAMDPSGPFAYVAVDGRSLAVINRTSLRIAFNIPLPGVYDVDLSPDGQLALATLPLNDEVAIVDTAANEVRGRLRVSGRPEPIVVAPFSCGAVAPSVPTATRTTPPRPTPTPGPCFGDCNGDGEVSINELIIGVRVALGQAAVEDCLDFDSNGDGEVSVSELIQAIGSALRGCTG